jgi:hypothetical protein
MSRLTDSRPQGETLQKHTEFWRRLLQTWQQLAASDPDGKQVTSLHAKRHGRVWLYARTTANSQKPEPASAALGE